MSLFVLLFLAAETVKLSHSLLKISCLRSTTSAAINYPNAIVNVGTLLTTRHFHVASPFQKPWQFMASTIEVDEQDALVDDGNGKTTDEAVLRRSLESETHSESEKSQ